MSEKKEKSEAKLLQEKLCMKKKNGLLRADDSVMEKTGVFCEGYKDFLDRSKTEREAVEYAVAAAEKKGFVPFKKGMALKAGDKVYYV
ncbi:MAG: aminopeptidase, partial [Oscillospiraceae bacterium]